MYIYIYIYKVYKGSVRTIKHLEISTLIYKIVKVEPFLNINIYIYFMPKIFLLDKFKTNILGDILVSNYLLKVLSNKFLFRFIMSLG